MQWVMEKRGICWVDHYIDDFITLGPPKSNQCQSNVETMHEVCEQLGLPMEPKKDEGPATAITFLGIELDSVAMEIRLPPEKLDRLRGELTTWRKWKAGKKRELLSLIGQLSHTCKAIRTGRSFLRGLIDLSMAPKAPGPLCSTQCRG